MEVEPQVHAWNEEVEEEEEAGLLGRQFRHHHSNFEEASLENGAVEAEENGTEKAEKIEESGTETVEKSEENGSEIAEKTEENGSEIAEKTEEVVAERTEENGSEIADKTEENGTVIAEKTEDIVAEKTEENGTQIAERTEEVVAERTEETGTEIAEKTEENGIEIAENGAEKAEENGTEEAEKSEETGHSKSVYFETHQGIWKCRHCHWTYRPPSHILRGGSTHGVSAMEFNGTESSALEISEDLDSRGNKFEIEPITSNGFSVENGKILPEEILSGLSPVVAQKLHDLTVEIVEELQKPAEKDPEDDVKGEVDDELVDLHVEEVLEKQNTHDLYCPNCNSCITRRVILRPRRRRVKNIRRKPKILDAPVTGTPTPAPNDNIGGQIIISRGGTPIAPAVDPSNDEPEYVSSDAAPPPPTTQLFKCLSCFSLFVPTANGCKLFQCFGGDSDPVSTPVQNRPDPTGSWWSKIFSSTKKPSSSTDVQPIDTEPQPVQIRPSEPQPAQTEPLGSQSIDQQLDPTEPLGPQSVDSMPIQTKQPEEQPVVPLPAQIKPTEPEPTDLKPVQLKPRVDQPDGPKPVQTKPREEQPVVPLPAQIKPMEPQPTDPKPIQSMPRVDQPDGPKPVQTKPAGTDTVQTHAGETRPNVSHAAPVKPGWKYWIIQIFSSEQKEVPSPQGDDDAVIIDVEPHPIQPLPSQTKPLQTPLLQPHPIDTVQTQDPEEPPLDTQPTEMPETDPLPAQEVRPLLPQTAVPTETRDWDILKSIVYGGLVESITSLGVVSSAAGAGTKTLNILALGLASVVGGLFVMADKIKELRNDNTQTSEQEDQYQRLLGRRQNFVRHIIVAVISFLFFGLLPPVVYGFSFRESDDRDLKIAALAGSSLICIVLLAAAKAHVQNGSYWKTVMYYVSLGVAASGISFVVGDLFDELMEKLGLFKSGAELGVPFRKTEWASY